MDKIQAFKDAALLVDSASEASKQKATLANTLAWQAFFILRDGKTAEQVALKRIVAKDGEFKHHKATVSKARAVLEAFESGVEIAFTSKDGETVVETVVSSDTVAANKFSTLPEVTLSTLYTALRNSNKAERDDAEVERMAISNLKEQHGVETALELQQLLDGEYATALDNAKQDIVKAMASEKAAKSIDDFAAIKLAIANLSQSQVKEMSDYCLKLVAEDDARRESEAA